MAMLKHGRAYAAYEFRGKYVYDNEMQNGRQLSRPVTREGILIYWYHSKFVSISHIWI